MTNFSALKGQAELLLSKLEGKRYMLGDLNSRLKTAAEEHPHDTVIRAVANVIERMQNKNPEGIVSQAEMDKIYNELIGLNVTGTRFREVLGDLLISKKPTSVEPNYTYLQGIRNSEQDVLAYDVDQKVKSNLDTLFDPISDKYDPELAAHAKEKINLELKSLGFDPRLRIAGGNSRFVIFAAELDTNRGMVSVFVPAEASGEQLPSIFIAEGKVNDLTKPNLQAYLDKTASKRSDSGFSGNSVSPIEIPQIPTPEPLKVLATEIDENVIEAATGFQQASVRLAKSMIVVELDSMGFKGSQVRVAFPAQNGFICEATLNTPRGKVTIEVPVDIKNNKPLMPSVFAKGDYVADFDAPSLQAFAMSADLSPNGFVHDSDPLFGMSLSELKDVIVRAAVKNNFDKCNEAMEVISNRFDENTYRNVAANYHRILTNLESAKDSLVQAHEDSDQFVKTPNSIYPIHKRLGRPIHDLIKDENGKYHLKSTYSARQNEGDEGAFFSNAKVLVGD